MDLHAWITQQVDAVEAAARKALDCTGARRWEAVGSLVVTVPDENTAGLDQPQPPEPTPAQKRRLRERARLIVPITTSDVPEALRGPRWKP